MVRRACARYRYITLPLLRPALLVAAIINMINVFNSFPIIWAMTQGGPGSQTDTTTTFMYKLAFRFQDIGQSAALSVVNLGGHPPLRAPLPPRRGLAEGIDGWRPRR